MHKGGYPFIEVSLTNFENRKDYTRTWEIRESYIGTFIVHNRIFNVIGTTHSISRLEERGISRYHVLSTILGLGEKLLEYNNSGNHIIISDETKNVSTVFTIESNTIVIITVMDKGAIYISPNSNKRTIYETFNNVS
jgi:hypothetical protein